MGKERNWTGPFGYGLLRGSANYECWAMKTKAILTVNHVWEVIDSSPVAASTSAQATSMSIANVPTPAQSPDGEVEAWHSKDNQAKAIIVLQLSDDILGPVKNKETAKEMWEELRFLYEDSECNLRQRHFNALYLANYDDENSMESYIAKKRGARDALQRLGFPESPRRVYATTILSDLGPKFEWFRDFKYSTDKSIDDLDPDQLMAELLDVARRPLPRETNPSAHSKRRRIGRS